MCFEEIQDDYEEYWETEEIKRFIDLRSRQKQETELDDNHDMPISDTEYAKFKKSFPKW